jgi:NRAMP (natural resistance-associated macrophage protein)-like metal ion transporter
MNVRKYFADLGPGLISGAADDDPSGISTYSVVGATFGYAQLWTVFLTFPLMIAVQLMCARMALVTGEGLAGTIGQYANRRLLWLACVLLVIANVVNIGADFAGMAEALEMVTHVHRLIWLPVIAGSLIAALVFSSYRVLASVLKWLTLVLFSYVVAAYLARPDWAAVLRASFIPQIQLNAGYLSALVAILGTTITPYMFFWQASQEIEEEVAQGMDSLESRRGADPVQLRAAAKDVVSGMAWAGVTMFFIIVTTATTLHGPGHSAKPIETAQQAAEALRPLAGDAAYLLFTLGIVGTGLLAIPVLAGSAGYAVAEAMHWRASLNDKPRVGWQFYSIVVLAIVVGALFNFLHISAVKALFYAAVVNGVLAVPLVGIVTRLTSDPRVMGDQKNPRWLAGLGWATTGIMAVAALAMIVTSF